MVQRGEVSIVTMIFSAQTMVTVLLSTVFLKEKLSRYQVIGIMVTFLGLVLVSG